MEPEEFGDDEGLGLSVDEDLTGDEADISPDEDPIDPNLSATYAEVGAQDRKEEMGIQDAEEFLDDPELAEAEF